MDNRQLHDMNDLDDVQDKIFSEEESFAAINLEELLSEIHTEEILPLGGGLSREQQRRVEDRIFRSLQEDTALFTDKTIQDHGYENWSLEQQESAGMKVVSEKKTKHRKKLFIILAAAIIAVFGITAGAAVEFEWDRNLLDFMGIRDGETLQVGSGHVDLDISSTCFGMDYRENPAGQRETVTMMVTESIGDNKDAYIRIDTDFVLPETFDSETDYIMPENFSLDIYKRNKKIVGSSVFSSMNEDGKLYFLLSISPDKDVNNTTIRLNLENLYWYHDLNAEDYEAAPPKELIYEGVWQMEWKFDYDTHEKTYHPQQIIEVDGVKIRIEKVVVAPLGIHIYGSKAPGQPEEMNLFDIGKIKVDSILYWDGTRLEPEGIDHMGIYQGKEIDVHINTERIGAGIDVDQVKSITVEGVEIRLKR